MKQADVDKLVARISSVRGVPAESMTPYWNMMIGDVVNGPRGKVAHEWAARQAYIALGNIMTCAAVLGVDACPMEGLNPVEYDKVLGLNGSGYKTVVACAFGYRAASDKYAKLAKVRFAASDLIRVI
jgi:nitroreductase